MVNSSLKSEWLPFSTLTPDSLARRNHKERAQPLHRQRLGLLEKHKDYVHRARDHRSKQDRVRKLREKAAFRNKDEFYWGMVKGKTKGGVALTDRGNEALSVDLVKVLKTQDVGYVRVQIAKDVKVGPSAMIS
jgi:U3 small nucleolar RNA-associated protein 11